MVHNMMSQFIAVKRKLKFKKKLEYQLINGEKYNENNVLHKNLNVFCTLIEKF